MDLNRVDQLEAAVALLTDKAAIAEHTALYNVSWDEGHLADWVSTWTADGTFSLPGAPDTTGHDALLAMVSAMQGVGFVHLTMNHRIAIDGDRATQSCAAVLAQRSRDGDLPSSAWMTTGRYEDVLRREADGWRFERRTFVADGSLRGLPRWW